MHELLNADCMEWMADRPKNSIAAIVTDPPYAFTEYDSANIGKLRSGKGGNWRIPPSFDGAARKPLPRFSVVNDDAKAREKFLSFFREWGRLALRILMPGGHIFMASTPLLADLLGNALRETGLERRGEIMRLVTSFRGGDRPKGAEREFPGVSVLPKAGYEPWLLYRKPLSEKTVAANLRRWGTGALGRPSADVPFSDVIVCGRTPALERTGHPSQKPLALMRAFAHASLPLGFGIILDPFAGSGVTLAAATSQGLLSIGIEKDSEFFRLAQETIPKLLAISGPEEEFSFSPRAGSRYAVRKNPLRP